MSLKNKLGGNKNPMTEYLNDLNCPSQKVFLVKRENYIYSVPHIEDTEKIFLKTKIPNSEATKKYLGGKK